MAKTFGMGIRCPFCGKLFQFEYTDGTTYAIHCMCGANLGVRDDEKGALVEAHLSAEAQWAQYEKHEEATLRKLFGMDQCKNCKHFAGEDKDRWGWGWCRLKNQQMEMDYANCEKHETPE